MRAASPGISQEIIVGFQPEVEDLCWMQQQRENETLLREYSQMVHGSAFWKMIQSHFFNEFAVVLFLISRLLKLNSEYSKKTLTILFDNASIHKSSLIFKVKEFLKIKLLFLPPYSPELAAVEFLFKGVKSITRKLIKQKLIDFSKEDEAKVIMEASSWNQQEVHSKLLDFNNYYGKRSY